MQPAPFRLQQAIWTAFKAARPSHSLATPNLHRPLPRSVPLLSQPTEWPHLRRPSQLTQVRFYADNKTSEIDKKVEDAKNKIHESLESRADNVRNDDDPLKKDETIIHTLPEASSIVYNRDSPGETAARAHSTTTDGSTAKDTRYAHDGPQEHSASSSSSSSPTWRSDLPSQLTMQYSRVRSSFTSFMDNFQTHVFTASRRLNDLTGYSSIERLKQDIEAQEDAVRNARQHVRDSRSAYSSAIETRSATQREVNDLLHRKHTWAPGDLERFTNLYRSDHANEQAEQKAHIDLSTAESAYEEASTKLSRSILARYHEEQVWSDKIRQMSTWGTWGLMGLNVLLFIVFQILVEPWRRRRLVRGFEEKVQEALRTKAEDKQLIANLQAEKIERNQALQAENVIPALATTTATMTMQTNDVGHSDNPTAADESTPASITPSERDGKQSIQIEQAAEAATTAQLLSESTVLTPPGPESPIAGTPLHIDPDSRESHPQAQGPDLLSNNETLGSPSIPISLPSISSVEYTDIPFLLGSYTRSYFDQAKGRLESSFDENQPVTTTRRDLTAKMLEGAFFGAVGAVTLFWVVGVGRR